MFVRASSKEAKLATLVTTDPSDYPSYARGLAPGRDTTQDPG